MSEKILTSESGIITALTERKVELIKEELKNNIDFSKSLEIKDFTDKKRLLKEYSR